MVVRWAHNPEVVGSSPALAFISKNVKKMSNFS